MYYNYIKSVHVISIVSWMAALFYAVSLFIYHTEANDKIETEGNVLKNQFKIMERRLWNVIATPAMILSFLTGTYMMIDYEWYKQPWMMVKFTLVIGLLVYHFFCQHIINQMGKDVFSWSSYQLRLWRELATLFLVAIVFVVMLKNAVNWLYGTLGFVAFGVVIMLAVKIYKNYRTRPH